MPETIVPQVATVRKIVSGLRAVHQSPFQAMYGLPKHSPAKQVTALLDAAVDLTFAAELLAKQLNHAEERITQLEASLGIYPFTPEMEAAWLAEMDAREFMETCAAEHSFRDILR